MKKLFITLALIGLSYSSLKAQQNTKASDEINHIRTELMKSHDEYQFGLTVVGAGLVCQIPLIMNENKEGVFKYIPYVGIGLGTLGTILMIDSHKHINRAGLGINGNGLTINYTF